MAAGGAFAIGATSYSIGDGARMGPGYFPLMLGILLAILGAAVLFQSLVVETADGPLRARAPAAPVARGQAILSIRPERIRLEPLDVLAAGCNRLTGRIVEAIYMGRGRKYVIETASGARLTVTQPAAGGGTVVRNGGEAVAALFAPQDAVIIVDTE